MYKMIRHRSGNVLLFLALIPFAPSHAAEQRWPFVFDGGRLIVKSSPGELSEAKSTLLHVDEKHIPASMNGGVLFDGEVVRQLPSDKFGQPIWQVKSSHFLLGKDKVAGDTIVLVSPTIKAGGVAFRLGKKYRIFTVALEGRFYVWNAVVAELKQ